MQSKLIFAFIALSACGKAADGTAVEATREQRIDALAAIACNKYEECNGGASGAYTSGKNYTTRDACVNDYKTKGDSIWPADKCSNGRMNDAKYQICADAVKVYSCSGGFFDGLGAFDKCQASDVCIDPSH